MAYYPPNISFCEVAYLDPSTEVLCLHGGRNGLATPILRNLQSCAECQGDFMNAYRLQNRTTHSAAPGTVRGTDHKCSQSDFTCSTRNVNEWTSMDKPPPWPFVPNNYGFPQNLGQMTHFLRHHRSRMAPYVSPKFHPRHLPDEKLKWIEALNCWVPENQSQKQVPYVTFVSNPPIATDRGSNSLKIPGYEIEDVPPCDRYEAHFALKSHDNQQSNTLLKYEERLQRVNLRREALQNKKHQHHGGSPNLIKKFPPAGNNRSPLLARKQQGYQTKDDGIIVETPRVHFVEEVENTNQTHPGRSTPVQTTSNRTTDSTRNSEETDILDKDIYIRMQKTQLDGSDYESGDSPEKPDALDRILSSKDREIVDKKFPTITNDGASNGAGTCAILSGKFHPRRGSNGSHHSSSYGDNSHIDTYAESEKVHHRLQSSDEGIVSAGSRFSASSLRNRKTSLEQSSPSSPRKHSSVPTLPDVINKSGRKRKSRSKQGDRSLAGTPALPPVPLQELEELEHSVTDQPELSLIESKERTLIQKKVKVQRDREPKPATPPGRRPPPPPTQKKKTSDWIFDDSDDGIDSPLPLLEKKTTPVPPPTPSPSPTPESVAESVDSGDYIRVESVTPTKSETNSENDESKQRWKRWGSKARDSSVQEELDRQQRAEERRKKAHMAFDKLRNKKYPAGNMQMFESMSPTFDDYNFLNKYCIFRKYSLEMFRKAFDSVDEEGKGYLTQEETLIALTSVNRGLTDLEEKYLYRVLELTGYKADAGADFKLFSVLSALSLRIAALDEWMKNLIGQIDFKMLDMKLFLCRRLWECNVDPETNNIPIDQLCVELRAGGVSYQHELEVREKLQHLSALDLLDFLTYVPLFIMIHESVVDNPLDNSRRK